MLAPNTLLQNRYLIIRSIGQGGMGAVYLARDQRLGNTVALKETFFTDARMRRAFEREARLLAHLRHTALPKVIDHFDEGDGQFLVMEFIAGDDLEVLLAQRGRPFEVQQVLHWADQLLDALEYLHIQETPILHRDIKPANLKLTSRDQIVLLDFGLAKGDAGQMTSVATSRSVLGFTPNFAPLEQIQGTGTDPRSDLYSLGATLYYLMTGVIPPNALSRATASVSELPDPLRPADEIDSRIPPAIAEVLQRAVALNPGRRPATAADMRKALSAVIEAPTIGESSELKTLRIEDSAQANSTRDPQATIPAPTPTIAGPLPVVTAPVTPSNNTVAGFPDHAPLTGQTKKRSAFPWIVGGIVALLVVGVVTALFVINPPWKSNQWEDTESNRAADVKAGVAARVNGKPITLAQVDVLIDQQTEGRTAQLSPAELQQARLKVLDSLIQREALYQRAEKEKISPSDQEITATIDKQKLESRMTDEEFQSQLRKQNLTLEKLREEARKDMAIKSLQDKHTGKVTVTDKEVEDYYNKNKDVFVSHRGVGLSMIVADPADNSAQGIVNDAKGESEAKTKIDNVARQLSDGTDFGTAARAISEDANSLLKGGDIGFATEKELRDNGFSENLIDQFFGSMAVGETTAPTRFSSGKWFIFKLTQRRLHDENLTLESPGVRQQTSDALINQQKEILNAQLLTTTMNETKVVNYLAANKIGN